MSLSNIPDTDQWLTTGRCDRCRRFSYCKSDCKPHRQLCKKLYTKVLTNLLMEKLNESSNTDDSKEA